MFEELVYGCGRLLSFGKVFAFLWILGGLLGVAGAVYDQQHGIAVVTVPGRYPTKETADEVTNPEAFRNLMAYQWLRAFGALFVGTVILGIIKRQDALDPFSPGFGGKAVDELERALEQRSRR